MIYLCLESFIVWMRTAGLSTFRKLYAKIEQPLTPGTYDLEIVNNFDVSSFGGSKHFVLSTTNIFGAQVTSASPSSSPPAANKNVPQTPALGGGSGNVINFFPMDDEDDDVDNNE